MVINNKEISGLCPAFERFPKVRPDLPPRYKEIYQSHIIANRLGGSCMTGISSRLERWMHRQIGKVPGARILEIGAGNLNHVSFEVGADLYDVVEPFRELLDTSPDKARVGAIYADINDVPLGNRYDKILSVAVLEHLCDLPAVIARAIGLLEPGGIFCAGVPSEGTACWRLAWELTTGLEFRFRHRLDYGVLMRYEHVNTAEEIAQVLNWFFQKVSRKSFGIVPALSLYQVFECSLPQCHRFPTDNIR